MRAWETIELDICVALPDYLLTWPNLKLVRYWGPSYLEQLEWLGTTGEDAAKWVEILEVGNLTSLNLEKNDLTSLPDSIGNLINLKELDLEDNQLTRLPESLGNLTNLTDLNLYDNPISEAELSRLKSQLPTCDIEF